MNQFETLQPQYFFPNEDLDPANVPFIEFYLQRRPEVTSHVQQLEGSMRTLHTVVHYALNYAGIKAEDAPKEYAAFRKGFASLEYMANMVNPWYKRDGLMVRNTGRLLTNLGALPEIDLADSREKWHESHPNVNGVLLDAGTKAGESMAELHSRSMGAQVAWELQRVD